MKSVLIISDDKELASAFKKASFSNQFNFSILPSQEYVVDKLIEFKPDLILIDFLLNNTNGGSLCHQIRGHRDLYPLPLILLTHYPNIERFITKFGCNAIIRKPVAAHELIDNLNKMLDDPAIAPRVLGKAS